MSTITADDVMALVKENLPFGSDAQEQVSEDAVLVDIGVDSLHLITLLLTLQRHYSIDMGSLTENGMPITVADLVGLVQRAAAR